MGGKGSGVSIAGQIILEDDRGAISTHTCPLGVGKKIDSYMNRDSKPFCTDSQIKKNQISKVLHFFNIAVLLKVINTLECN